MVFLCFKAHPEKGLGCTVVLDAQCSLPLANKHFLLAGTRVLIVFSGGYPQNAPSRGSLLTEFNLRLTHSSMGLFWPWLSLQKY